MRTIPNTITDRSLDVLSEREKAVSVRGSLKRALSHLDDAFTSNLASVLDDESFLLLVAAEANLKSVQARVRAIEQRESA